MCLANIPEDLEMINKITAYLKDLKWICVVVERQTPLLRVVM